jgi:hypothetical protein
MARAEDSSGLNKSKFRIIIKKNIIMKNYVISVCLVFLIPISINAQVGINTDASTPDASAMLDIKSTDKGILIPRLTTTQRTAISNPATGLLVFDQTTAGFWFYDGSNWTDLSDGDNLGNHIATQNIQLGDNRISRSGATDLGLTFDASKLATFRGPIGAFEILKIQGDDNPQLSIEQLNFAYPYYKWSFGGNEQSFTIRDAISNTYPFRIKAASSNNVLVIDEDNVGIGTTTPDADFEVQNDEPEIRLTDGAFDASASWNTIGKITFNTRDATNNGGSTDPSHTIGKIELVAEPGGGAPDGQLEFSTGKNAEGTTIRMVIDHDGDVGIGTREPDQLLHLSGVAGTDGIKFPDNSVQISAYPKTNEGNVAIGDGWISNDGNTNDGISFTTDGNIKIGDNYLSKDGDDEGIRINSHGHVGFGSAPSASTIRVVSDGVEAGYAGVFLNEESADGTVLILGINQENTPVLNVVDENYNKLLLVEGDGKIGIMTGNPQYALQVGNSGDGTQARANSWNTFSDRRWKTDLQKVENPLKKINSITGYYYKWIDKVDTTAHFGVMAQDVEAVLPEIVSADDDGYKSVDYSKLSALLIEGIKEQNKKIEKLNTENDFMRDQIKEISELKAMITTLKTDFQLSQNQNSLENNSN